MNKLFSRRRGSKIEAVLTDGPQGGKANFFSLPAELRIKIYTHAAEDIYLTILKRGRAGTIRIIPGLLLVSQRCRMEFLPIMLANSALTVIVVALNFSNVMRVVGGLYKTELKALRSNNHLTIILDGSEKASQRDLRTNLRPWVKHQAKNIDRVPWRFRVDACGTQCVRTLQCSHVRLLVLLREEALSHEEILGWEVRIMLESIDASWDDRAAPIASSQMSRLMMTGDRVRRDGIP